MRKALLFLLLMAGVIGAAAQPNANFTATPLTGCPPMVVSFTNLSTGSPTSWSWDFGNGTFSSVQHPIISYSTPGTYTVKLTAINAAGSNTMTKLNYVVVKTPPTVSISATPLTACAKVPITFTSSVVWNASGTGTYIWDFGDGGTSGSANPTHTYSTGGNYTVKLTAVNGSGCPTTDTEVNFLTIYSPPAVGFYATDTAVCSIGGTTTFVSTTGGAGPFSYIWDFGDGSGPSTSASPVSHAYFGAAKFSPKLLVTDAHGCTDSLKLTNYINVHTVVAAASVPSTACVGAPVSVSTVAPTTTGAALTWDFGDGYTATGTAAGHTYLAAGTYNIKLTATVGGCTDMTTHSITISPKPSASFTYSPAIPCPAPSVITFTNNTTGTFTSSWDFGDGFTSTATSPLHTYTFDSTFAVKLTVTSPAGCTSTQTQTVPVLFTVYYIKARPPSGCVPAVIHLSDTLYALSPTGSGPYPSPQATWTWNFGDGTGGNSATPIHTYNNPGTYSVTVASATANGCVFQDTFTVRVGQHAIPNFWSPNRNICNNTLIQFFDSTYSPNGPITEWYYYFGDGGFSPNTPNPTYIYTKPGSYNVTLVTSQNGCLDTIIKPAYINVGLPGSAPRYQVSCSTFGYVQFIDSSIGATSMIWHFGDGTSSTATNPSHQYAGAGVYVVSQVTFNSASGCKDSVNTTVTIPKFNIELSANDSTVCKGDTVIFSPVIINLAPGVPVAITSTTWSVPAGLDPPPPMPPPPPDMFLAHTRGRYTVTLTVKDANGCFTSKTDTNFITIGGPIVHFKATPPLGCAPATIVLTDTTNYVPSTHAAQLYWDFGDGSNTTINNPLGPSVTHFYPNTGGYAIFLRVRDNIGCMDSFGVSNYVVVTRPTAFFGSAGIAACAGTAFNFFSSSTGTGITHQWTFGDGGTSTLSSPSHIYTTPGVYNVRLIVTDYAGCKDTMYKPGAVNVSLSPHAAFAMDDTMNVCPPLIVNFTNSSSGAASYNWNFGNGTGSSLLNPSATYASPGLYLIRLIVTNSAGCKDTATGRARILGYPGGVLSYSPLNGCAPFTVNFTANNVNGVPGFIYDFGDGTTAATTATAMSHTYTKPGPHLPVITLTDNLGCSAASAGLDSIHVDGVIAGFTFSPFPACDKGTIQFQDTSHGMYSALLAPNWKFHDGTTSSLGAPSKTYTAPGTYPVTLYSHTAAGCLDTFRSNVVFYPLPKIIAGSDTTICISDSALLKPRGGVSYTWSPAGSLSCASCPTPYAMPTVPTQYVVTGTDANGCSSVDTITVSLRYKTITDVKPASIEICSGDTTMLVSTPGATTYQWTPSAALGSPDSSATVAFPIANQQYVLISRFAGCQPDTDFVDVIVHPTPGVKAAPGQTIVAGTPVQLEATATGIITKWLWTPTDGLFTPEAPGTDASPKQSTTYHITVATEYGCTATDTVRILVTCDNSQVYLPNTFTPDNNGVNDVFYPRGRGLSTINHFRIYNRWGELVFERNNIAVDDKKSGWDGRKGDRLLSPDVYVYTIDALCDTGEPLKWQGDVLLLR